MPVYLSDIPLSQAQLIFQHALEKTGLWQMLGVEEIPLDESALGRVLAQSVWARQSSPHYNAVGMDGFAVRAADTAGVLPSRPVTLQYGSQTQYFDTGDPLPLWADAVIPIEEVEAVDENGNVQAECRHPTSIRLRSAVTPWKNVRPLGEDIVETQLVLPAGHILRAVDLGALAACAENHINVAHQPRITVIPTGTELIPIGTPARPGDIIEFNSVVLAAQLNSWGAKATRLPILSDDFELITSSVREAAETSDLILLNAGSSAGAEDFSSRVISSLGAVLVHGIAVRPGHPVILGMIRRKDNSEVPIVGVPGYPVSAALTNEILVKPLVEIWLGVKSENDDIIDARLTRKVTSPAGDDEYLRVVLGKVNGTLLAAPLAKGAGMITTLVNADGLTIIPRGVQGLEAGTPIKVKLYKTKNEIENTLFAIGSHDLTLDLLTQELQAYHRRLISSNVGSLGGLLALANGQAHLAGSHLLDPETGEYNLQAIHEFLSNIPVRLVHWVGRLQGLMVSKGNPLGISSLQDLTRPEVRYVNRQRGAGTRVLLDFELRQSGISTQEVRGYDYEEMTHLTVGAAIQSGRANCGLGIAAAAQALGLDFIPLYTEEYDLVIPLSSFRDGLIDPVMELAFSPAFREKVAALPGYTVDHMGEIAVELNP